MKISDNFVVSTLAGENIILPIDCEYIDYNSVFVLNDTAMFIVSCLPAEKEDVVAKIVDNYDISVENATKYLHDFLAEVGKYGIIE